MWPDIEEKIILDTWVECVTKHIGEFHFNPSKKMKRRWIAAATELVGALRDYNVDKSEWVEYTKWAFKQHIIVDKNRGWVPSSVCYLVPDWLMARKKVLVDGRRYIDGWFDE